MSKIINRFQPEVKPKNINIKFESNSITEYAEGLGFLPFIWYNSYTLDLHDISLFELSIVDGLPTLKMTFQDSPNLMRDQGFPLDDSRISVFINPRTTQLKPIHLDFKIVDFKVSEKNYTCIGVIDVKKLYIKEFKSYKNLSSYELLQKLSKETGLGFNSNVESSNDKMTWINTGDKVQHFLEKIIDNSYLSDQSFILGYIDFYYNFNYVDLQKELTRKIESDNGISNTGLELLSKQTERENVSKLFLTNDNAFFESNIYFESYTILNKSTGISISKGYKTIIKYYNNVSKEYLPFTLDSITDDAKSKIVLKGLPNDSSFKNENLDYIYKGKLDPDNMHINYAYAQSHNDRNLFDLEKIGLEIEMKIPNFNIYKFQKILVLISNQAPNVQESQVNQRLSGEWLIIDIKYKMLDLKFTQIVTLVRRELDVPSNELK